jgi:hypothetical protein
MPQQIKLRKVLRKFFDDFEWIHITLGLIGNLTFFVGSIFFLQESLKIEGTWLFIIGSFLMLIGSIGNGLVRYVENKKYNK